MNKITKKQVKWLIDMGLDSQCLRELSLEQASELIKAIREDRRIKTKEYEAELVPFNESFY